MSFAAFTVSILTCLLTLTAGAWLFPYAFADRVTTPLVLAEKNLLGARFVDLPIILSQLDKELSHRNIPIEFRGHTRTTTLEKLGVELNIPVTVRALQAQPHRWRTQRSSLDPQFILDQTAGRREVETMFQNIIVPPQNAVLTINPAGKIQVKSGNDGEAIDSLALADSLRAYLSGGVPGPVSLRIMSAPPRVQDHEVERAGTLAETLIENGLTLQFEERTFTVTLPELRRLLEFGEQIDPQEPQNYILGVRLEPRALRTRLSAVAEELNQEPVDAKFEISQAEGEEAPRVNEFAPPQRGLTLNVDASAEKIAHAITVGDTHVPLVVDVVQPKVAEYADLENLGITTLIARGESNFTGSPRNRVHNILVGASRYHGLLVPPGEEFSFNQHLGPVNASAGFKPELVIKANSTVPEFGGGLCQVSTTVFRAAVQSGLEVTQRKNHAYAVRYYGTAGFDATIYPGYTDLRFRNNTPGHILIQTKVEGTRLIFDFWGTPDGRKVEVDGPHPYQRRPDGAVKATLTQRVLRDDQVVFEKTFHSNYRSPNLYPKVLASNVSQPTPPPAVTPTPTVAPTPRPATPKPSAKPRPPASEEGNS
ncbi:MAG: VanW family protein [Patescibacteria group bacterium]